MDIEKLKTHVKLCKKNLDNPKTFCCAVCPFESEIISRYPGLEYLFIKKRDILERRPHGFEKRNGRKQEPVYEVSGELFPGVPA